jgi:hypothetical protein
MKEKMELAFSRVRLAGSGRDEASPWRWCQPVSTSMDSVRMAFSASLPFWLWVM